MLRNALRPGQGHPRRPISEPELLRGHAKDQRRQRRVHDRHPMPRLVARLLSAGSSGCPGAPRIRPAICLSMPASPRSRNRSTSATTGSSTGPRPAGPSTTSDFHAQVAYSEAFADIQKAQQEYETGASTKMADIDKTGRGVSSLTSPDQGRRAPYPLLKRERREGRGRLVGPGRPPARQIQPLRVLRQRKNGPGAAGKPPRRSGRKPSGWPTSWRIPKNNYNKETRMTTLETPVRFQRRWPSCLVGGRVCFRFLGEKAVRTSPDLTDDERSLHGHHGRQGRLDRRLDYDHAHLRLRNVRLDVGPRPGRRPQTGQHAEDLAHQPVHDLQRRDEVASLRRPRATRASPFPKSLTPTPTITGCSAT